MQNCRSEPPRPGSITSRKLALTATGGTHCCRDVHCCRDMAMNTRLLIQTEKFDEEFSSFQFAVSFRSDLPHVIPRYQLLPHCLRSYICDVGSNIVRRFVSFSWYCLSSVTRLAWPSALVDMLRQARPARVGCWCGAGFHPLRSIPFKRGVL